MLPRKNYEYAKSLHIVNALLFYLLLMHHLKNPLSEQAYMLLQIAAN